MDNHHKGFSRLFFSPPDTFKMKMRKTRHDYWKFSQNIQEEYLNRKYQIGYLEAGCFLKSAVSIENLVPLLFYLAIADRTFKFARKLLKEQGLLK